MSHVKRFFAELVDGRQSLVVDVVLQQVLQLAQAVGNAGNEEVHPAEVVVLVVVQKVLELRVENLQVLLDQDLVAGLEQPIQGRLVQINLKRSQSCLGFEPSCDNPRLWPPKVSENFEKI